MRPIAVKKKIINVKVEKARKGTHKEIIKIFKKLNIDKKSKILDCGCGSGALLSKIHNLGYKDLTGFDIITPKTSEQFKFKKQDLNQRFAMDNGSFQIVFSVENLEHLENHWHFFRESHRVLKKGGYLILSTPNVETWYHKLYFFLFSEFLDFRFKDYTSIGHINPLFNYNLKRITNGFIILKHKYYFSIFPKTKIQLPLNLKSTSCKHFLVFKKI